MARADAALQVEAELTRLRWEVRANGAELPWATAVYKRGATPAMKAAGVQDLVCHAVHMDCVPGPRVQALRARFNNAEFARAIYMVVASSRKPRGLAHVFLRVLMRPKAPLAWPEETLANTGSLSL